jgi:hypothetical protein
MHPNSRRVLTAVRLGTPILLSYQLGLAEGITLLSRRDSEAEFSTLAEDEPSPVIDDRPKLDPTRPETRFYRAILRYHGGETRELSEEVSFTLP